MAKNPKMFTELIENMFKNSRRSKFHIAAFEREEDKDTKSRAEINTQKSPIEDFNTESPIEDFYNKQTVFITGATGFLGTLLVEKLLRCCPKVKLILLIRDKGKTVNERIRDYFADPVFESMRLSNPTYADRVNFACGTIGDLNFGLSPDDLRLLLATTTVVFHVAATVRFDEHIRVAFDVNVKGTRTLLSLARQMPQLRSFVHISTAFCHCDRRFIEEKFYPPVFTSDELSILMESATETELALLNDHLIGDKPNTYTLTKSTAEDLVRGAAQELPVCVFRPSIVFPTLAEPLPLWMKGFNSPLVLSFLVGIGLSRVQLIDPNISVDIVPADLCINALTALAWYQTTPHSTSIDRTDKTPHGASIDKADKNVFNFVSYNDNRVNSLQLSRMMAESFATSGESYDKTLWTPGYFLTSNERLYNFLFYVVHFLPLVFFSLGEKLTHQKPRVVKIYRKLVMFFKVLAYFGLNEWAFENDNMKSVMNVMSAQDRVRYNSLLSHIRWETMTSTMYRSITWYSQGRRLTKENYRKRMVYIERVDFWIRTSVKLFVAYLFLNFVANLVNSWTIVSK